MAKKSMNMNDLPNYFRPADTELFGKELEDFGEMNVPEESLDRVLSSTMRKAGFGMKETAMNGTAVITSNVKRETTKENENTEYTTTAKVHRNGVLAACFALLLVGAGAFIMFGSSRGLKTSPVKTPAAAVTETSSGAAAQVNETNTVIVPDVVGMNETQAAETLEGAGLTCVIHEVAADVGEAGKVIEMSVAPGSEVDRGAEVSIFVSTSATFENSEQAKQFIDKANSLRSLRDKITISFQDVFARFKNDYGFEAEFPDVSGARTEEELDSLEREYERYLNMGIEEFYSNLIDLNIDRIEAGTEHAVTTVTAITHEIEADTQPVNDQKTAAEAIPDVIGLTCEKAILKLKEAGLAYDISEVYSDKSDKGMVVGMSVGRDDEAEQGKYIILMVGTGETEPVMQKLRIDIPNDVEGSYTFDVYRGETLAYTKTVGNVAALDTGIVTIEVVGRGKERLAVYVKKNVPTYDDLNYGKYCSFDVDYDAGTVSLAGGGYNTSALYDFSDLT